MGLWESYERLLQKHTVLAPILTGVFLGVLSDVTAQLLVGDPYDPYRTVRFFFMGLLVMMPITKLWFTILEIVVPPESSKRAIKLLLVDQLIGSPIITAIMFTAMNFFRGEGWDALVLFFSKNFGAALLNGYMVWPLAQLINFTIVPDRFRMLFLNLVGFGFGVLMAMTLEPRKNPTKDEL